MNPPIPDPIVVPRDLNRGPRPEAMKYFIAVDMLLCVAGITYCDGSLTGYSVVADFIYYFLMIMILLALLWALWKGVNWARIVIMVLCALSLFNLFMLGEE